MSIPSVLFNLTRVSEMAQAVWELRCLAEDAISMVAKTIWDNQFACALGIGGVVLGSYLMGRSICNLSIPKTEIPISSPDLIRSGNQNVQNEMRNFFSLYSPEERLQIMERARSFVDSLEIRPPNPAIYCAFLFAYRYFKSKQPDWNLPPLEKAPSLRLPHSGYRSMPFQAMPRDLAWRLGIDWKAQSEGPDAFDRDASPGFRQGMENGYQLVDALRPYRMNAFLFLWLHDALVHGVSSDATASQLLPKGYAPRHGYLLHTDEIQQDTIDELLQELQDERLLLTRDLPSSMNERGDSQSTNFSYLSVLYSPYVRSTFQPGDEWKFDAIFNQFYERAQAATTRDEKLKAVCQCIRALLMFHALPDGNGRTVCVAVLAILLDQIGSPPAMLRNSYLFEGTRTAAQMVVELKELIALFERLKLEVEVMEMAGITPVDQDASDYQALQEYYSLLDSSFINTL